MEDDYWNASSVKNKASQQRMFDIEDNATIDRFKTRSDPLIDHFLDSSRSAQLPNTSGSSSVRFRPTAATNNSTTTKNDSALQTKSINNTTKTRSNIPPKAPSPAPQISRPNDTIIESARFGRSPATTAASSDDAHSSPQWLPSAEEYPNQTTKDRSTQYDKQMEILCKKLLENKNVQLDDIRDYDQKASLLRQAVLLGISSVTIPVMIFLENTLSRQIFYELIKIYPPAVNNYINISKLRFENDQYIAMLKQFGRNEDVAMRRLQEVNRINDVNSKLAMLDQAAIELGSHPWWHSQVSEYRHFVKKQRELSLPQANVTVLEAYKSVYGADFRLQKQNRVSDKTATDRTRDFETTHRMAPELIMCGKLSVIMQCDFRKHHDDFIHQAALQGLFGKKYVISPEYLADMIYNWARASGEGQQKACEVAEKFLKMIPDSTRRIYFAEKLQHYDVAIDAITNVLRDRSELENLRRRMPRDHPAFNRATSALENTKWRN